MISKKILFIVILIIVVVFGIKEFKKYETQEELKKYQAQEEFKIKKILSAYDVKTMQIVSSQRKVSTKGDLHTDYFVKGYLKNNSPFTSYIQTHENSSNQTGFSIKNNGDVLCTGFYLNPKLNLCDSDDF